MNSSIYLAFCFSLLISICKPPLNFTFDILTISNAANLLINISSSNFPGPAMMNYVLYGSFTDGNSYMDFLSSYGNVVANPDLGDIVIGKDGMLGGVFDSKSNIVIPIPNGNIQKVPISLLPKYFPKGYIYKSPNYGDYTNIAFKGSMYGKTNEKNICNPCDIEVWNYKQVPTFQHQSVFWFNQLTKSDEIFIDFFGYFNKYDPNNKNGSLTVSFTKSNLIDNPAIYQIVDSNLDDTFFYTINEKGELIFNGSLLIGFKDKYRYYYISGNLLPIKEITKSI